MGKIASLTAAALLAMAGTAASAATITFDGMSSGTNVQTGDFVFSDLRVVSGNCAAGRCGAENDNESTVLSTISGSVFDVSSMWFQLLGRGNGNAMTLSTDKNTIGYDFASPNYQHNTGYTLNLADAMFNGDFSGISWLSIATSGGGNIRFDNLQVAPVPLPAAGLMLLAGVGGLAALRRRKAA